MQRQPDRVPLRVGSEGDLGRVPQPSMEELLSALWIDWVEFLPRELDMRVAPKGRVYVSGAK
jgi:hypothetical protein